MARITTSINIICRANFVLWFALLSACTNTIDHSSFTLHKTYAVVAFGLTSRVKFIDESTKSIKLNQTGSSRMLSTRPVANGMAREFIGGLMLNAPVKIIHGRRVTEKNQYRKLLSSNAHLKQRRYIAAGMYHNFWYEDFSQSKELAKALNVDGVILIRCDLEVSGRAKYLSDGNIIGTYRPEITSRIAAYDKHGKQVINSRIKYKSARKVVPDISGVHFLELRRTLAGYDARLAGIAAAKKLWSGLAAGTKVAYSDD